MMVAIVIGLNSAAQDCNNLFISEYVEGSSNNKAIEIYNPMDAVIDLSTYNLVRYGNGGTTPKVVNLAGGYIQPFGTYVVVLDKRDPNGTGFETPVDMELQEKADTFLCPIYNENPMMYFNGNDAVTLEKTNGDVIDIFSRVGYPDPENGWTNITDTTITWNNQGTPEDYTIADYIVGPLFWLSWTRDNTLVRKQDVLRGVTENPEVFNVALEWDSIPNNTFDNLGFHLCDCHYVGNAENKFRHSVKMYPNPATHKTFTISASQEIKFVSLVNQLGQIVFSREFVSGKDEVVINGEFLTSGIYFVTTKFVDKSINTEKLIVK